MEAGLDSQRIRNLAEALDDAIEHQDVPAILSFFSNDCEISLPGVNLSGHEGLSRAISWMYEHLEEVVLVPLAIAVQDDLLFEEFILRSHVRGHSVDLRQAEVLRYGGDYKVRSLHLYFDRLEFAQASPSGVVDRMLAGRVSKVSLRGLS